MSWLRVLELFEFLHYYHITEVANDPPLANLKRLHLITTFLLLFLPKKKNTVCKVL